MNSKTNYLEIQKVDSHVNEYEVHMVNKSTIDCINHNATTVKLHYSLSNGLTAKTVTWTLGGDNATEKKNNVAKLYAFFKEQMQGDLPFAMEAGVLDITLATRLGMINTGTASELITTVAFS